MRKLILVGLLAIAGCTTEPPMTEPPYTRECIPAEWWLQCGDLTGRMSMATGKAEWWRAVKRDGHWQCEPGRPNPSQNCS